MGDKLVIEIVDVVFGNFICGGLPYAIMGHYVAEDFVQVLDPVRLPREEGVESDAHHAAAVGAFLLELVELGLTNLREVVSLVVSPEEGSVVQFDGVGYGNQFARFHFDGHRLIVVHPVGVVNETRLGH